MKDRMLATFSRLVLRTGWAEGDEKSAHGEPTTHRHRRHTGRGVNDRAEGTQGELLLKESDSLQYLLRRPAMFPEASPALLCFLHDHDQAAPCEPIRALTRHGPFAHGGSPILERFVVVAPQLPCSADAWFLYAAAIEEIVEHEAQQHACDPARIYLTGLSMGANGLFDLAHIQRHVWRGLWAVDPTRIAPLDDDCPLWLSIGAMSRPHSREWIRALNLQASARRHSRRVWEDSGLDHVLTARHAYEEERVYQWLLAQGN